MKTFKQYLNEQKTPTRKQLFEGGNAIKSSSMIHQANVKNTLESIYRDLLPKLKLSKSDVRVLGSTGKKDPNKSGTPAGSSGDIDLALSIPILMKNNNFDNLDDLYKFLEKITVRPFLLLSPKRKSAHSPVIARKHDEATYRWPCGYAGRTGWFLCGIKPIRVAIRRTKNSHTKFAAMKLLNLHC